MSTAQWMGLITGIIFGFLLQKGRVLRFDKQINAMLLKDMTIVKFLMSAILVGMIGITALSEFNMIQLSYKPMNAGAIIIGAILFGIGWAIVGYCLGTSVGALGEGRWHAIFAIAGMLAGAAAYAELYPFFKSTVLSWVDYGKIGLPNLLGISPWIIVLALWGICIPLFKWFEKKGI